MMGSAPFVDTAKTLNMIELCRASLAGRGRVLKEGAGLAEKVSSFSFRFTVLPIPLASLS
jgi:hypothetical protein